MCFDQILETLDPLSRNDRCRRTDTSTQTQRRPACANQKTRLIKSPDFDSEGVLDTQSKALLVSLGCSQVFANATQRRGALILHHKCYTVSTRVHLV